MAQWVKGPVAMPGGPEFNPGDLPGRRELALRSDRLCGKSAPPTRK